MTHPEDYITVADVVRIIGERTGRKIHFVSVYRWMTKGVSGAKLRSSMFGRQRLTTLAWLDEFGQRSAEARNVELEERTKKRREARQRSRARRGLPA